MYAIFLVGPSGSGKTTYRDQIIPHNFVHLSTDDLILQEATSSGRTYMEIFEDYYPTAEELFKQKINRCNSLKLDIVIDRTNLTEQSRKRILQLIHPDTKKIAIYFPAYTPEVLAKRIEGRVHQVPLEVIKMQHSNYRLPQKTEGFDLVVSSSHFIDILKVMDFQ